MNQHYSKLERVKLEDDCPSCHGRRNLRYTVKDIYSRGYVQCSSSSCRAKIKFDDSSFKNKLSRVVRELERKEEEYIDLLSTRFNKIDIEKR